jgi:hypothetical protein
LKPGFICFAARAMQYLGRNTELFSFFRSTCRKYTAMVQFFPAPFGDALEIRVFAIYNRFLFLDSLSFKEKAELRYLLLKTVFYSLDLMCILVYFTDIFSLLHGVVLQYTIPYLVDIVTLEMVTNII